MPEDYVILVNDHDKEIGTMEKLQAHREGKLHRAISVFIFNSKKELLLQKRADDKYHSGSLWTNTCCGHPRPGENKEEAAKRRLYEEMGIICPLTFAFNFSYKVSFSNKLSENEFDHVFTGITDDVPLPDPLEVSEWKYSSLSKIEKDMNQNPEQYTEWFKLIFEQIKKYA